MTITANMEAVGPGRVAISGTSEELLSLAAEVPGSRRVTRTNSDVGLLAPLSYGTWLALTAIREVEIGRGLRSWYEDEESHRISPALSLREQVTAEGSSLLYPFQRSGVDFLVNARRAVLADDLGTGKTRQALLALRELNNRGEDVFPVLVVAPNATKIPWKREAAEVWPELQVTIVTDASPEERQRQLTTPAHVYVVNWEALRFHSSLEPVPGGKTKRCCACGGVDRRVTARSCQTHPRELNAIDFKSVIADEVHRAKDRFSQQRRALVSATGRAAFRFGLSGTPIANHPADLWAVVNWCAPEDYPDYDGYVSRFLDVDVTEFGVTHVRGLRDDRRDEFFELLDPRLRRMPKRLVLPGLPPVVRQRRETPMGDKQRRAYEQMRTLTIAELDDDTAVSTPNPMARVTRLLQFASSYARIDADRRGAVRLADPSNKLDAFEDSLSDWEGESVVVFAESRQLIELLSARMTRQGIEHALLTGAKTGEARQGEIDRFQRGDVTLILCTIAAGGVGVTLTAGSVAVFLQRSWSMVNNEQAEGRVHRIGSERHRQITVVDFVTPGSLDEVVAQAHARKVDALEELLRDGETLKRLLETNDVETLEEAVRGDDRVE